MGCKSCGNKITFEKIKKGVVGIGKTVLQIGIADKETIKQRRNTCRNCEFATRNENLQDRPSKGLTTLSQCQKCLCFIHYKTQLITEHCPVEKW